MGNKRPKKNQSQMSLKNNAQESGFVYDESDIPTKKKGHPILKFFFRSFMFFLLLGASLAGGAGVGLALSLAKLPDVSALQYYSPIETTVIYNDKNQIMHKLFDEENREIVPLSDIPSHVQQAILAIEDSRFLTHDGVDFIGTLRALKANFDKNQKIQGGSTITQQVTKNLFLTPERTYQRKLAEAWLSREIEKKYSKEQILELYLNQVYWGHNAYGIEAASQTYFGKHAKHLTIAEGALIAGLLTGPEINSPYHDPEKAKHRQKLVLQRMVENHFLSRSKAIIAEKEPLKFQGLKHGQMLTPYFTSYVVAELKKKYAGTDVLKGGLKVYTTINTDLQNYAEKELTEHLKTLKRLHVEQGALVAVEPVTGHVKAIVGGTGWTGENQFNRAWQAQRQPGSSFKPFAYLTAFSRGFSPAHVEVDEPIKYRFGSYVWKPKNYGGGFSGAMTLQRALERSVNIVAVKIGEKVGNANVIKTAHKVGIQSPLKDVLSLPLGANEVTPLEMASAYSTFAGGGLYAPPTPILRIEDRFGNIIENNTKERAKQVFSKKHVNTLVKVMKGVIERGTAPAARIGRPAAGKTGTTSNHRDAWFVGFTPQLSTAVWVGNDTPSRMYGGATGGTFAAPLWAKFMKHYHKDLPKEDFDGAKGLMPILRGIGEKLTEEQKERLAYERLQKQNEREDLDAIKEVKNLPAPIEEMVPMAMPSTVMQMKLPNMNVPRTTYPRANTNQPLNINKRIQEIPIERPRSNMQYNPPPRQQVPAQRPRQVVNELDQLINELEGM